MNAFFTKEEPQEQLAFQHCVRVNLEPLKIQSIIAKVVAESCELLQLVFYFIMTLLMPLKLVLS